MTEAYKVHYNRKSAQATIEHSLPKQLEEKKGDKK